MKNTVCTRYEVLGNMETVYRLKDAIENSNGNAGKVLENHGLKPCDFGDNKLLNETKWRVLGVIDFDDTDESELDDGSSQSAQGYFMYLYHKQK